MLARVMVSWQRVCPGAPRRSSGRHPRSQFGTAEWSEETVDGGGGGSCEDIAGGGCEQGAAPEPRRRRVGPGRIDLTNEWTEIVKCHGMKVIVQTQAGLCYKGLNHCPMSTATNSGNACGLQLHLDRCYVGWILPKTSQHMFLRWRRSEFNVGPGHLGRHGAIPTY